VRRFVPIAALLALTVVLIPRGAEAKPVKSKLTADVFGIVDRQATLTYFFAGEVNAQNLTFACMGNRHVMLVRVERGGGERHVASAKTDFVGSFSAALEKRTPAIAGHYYVMVKPRVRRVKRNGKLKKLNCLGARTQTFLVQVPPEFAAAPVVPGM
jgi:hypothetical protein